MERLEIEKESLKARLEIDERSDGVISSQSARGAPTVAALGCSFPFCSLRNFKKVKFEKLPKLRLFQLNCRIFYQQGSTQLSMPCYLIKLTMKDQGWAGSTVKYMLHTFNVSLPQKGS
jgi:hypothetical protein